MKNTRKVLAITVIIAVIGFLAACTPPDDGGDDGEIETSITYTYDRGDYTYTLIIAKDFYRAAYKPEEKDEYFMIIKSRGGEIAYSTGTIDKIVVGGKTEDDAAATTKGDVFTLVGGENVSFKVTIEDNKIVDIDGTIPRVNAIPFNNEEHFEKWMSVVPANTKDTPYPVRLNLSGFSNRTFIDYFGGGGLNPDKYFSLDLNSSGAYIMERNAFASCHSLVSVTIGGGITSMGEMAFRNCSNLTSVTIGNGVTSIGEYAFEDCSSLASVTLGNGVTSIGMCAFWGCSSLASIIIPDSVTSIELFAFFGCSSLASVTLGSGVTNIGQSAFRNCSSLTSITIPNGVTSIEWQAFGDCSSLASIIISDSVIDIAWDAFSGTAWLDNRPDGLVYAGRVALLYKGDMPANTSITLLSGTKVIAANAFSSQENNTVSNLIDITIPNSVTTIEWGAFSGCDNLTAINVEAGNTTYSSVDGILYNKAQTEMVTVPRKISGNVTIPNTITSIEDRAFFDCENLTGVTIGNGVTSIGEMAFAYCNKLTSVIIGNGVTSIGKMAFLWCEALASVSIPDGVTSIGEEAFTWCIKLASVSIGNGVTSIGEKAFACCEALASVSIGNSVTSIGNRAFWGFLENRGARGSMTSVTIPASVTSIGYCAFLLQPSLVSVTFEKAGISMDESEELPGYNGDGRPIYYAFEGDLCAKYLAGGAGTYTTPGDGEQGVHRNSIWTKQQ
ncbi:MAG: leucine-rich repeat domain-containing protein [Treponema sp.]|nr:leucine-rich repeat domain-containing protein [Treponema sp.]